MDEKLQGDIVRVVGGMKVMAEEADKAFRIQMLASLLLNHMKPDLHPRMAIIAEYLVKELKKGAAGAAVVYHMCSGNPIEKEEIERKVLEEIGKLGLITPGSE